jgi:glucose-6-phosphate dehydrogenase assembly protein OpcA
MSLAVDIERELAELREEDRDTALVRTSTMTHIVWAPEPWVDAALTTLKGLSEQHPSRTIVLVPDPAAPDGVESEVRLESFVLGSLGREVCSEIIVLRLGGDRVKAAASLVLPLLRPNLPVFIRWRGRPPFHTHEFESLADVVDRLVVDSSEWPDLPDAYEELAGYFDRIEVSDIAWGRTERWRLAIADAWPGIAAVSELFVRGPQADALLLAGWLRSRLDRPVALRHEAAPAIELVSVDGTEISPPEWLDGETPSELLSRELDRLSRNRIYEQATRATFES